MAVAKQWAETIQQAGTDTETEELKNWAIQLLGSLADHERDKEAALVDVLSALLEKGAFHSNLQAKTLALRGQFLSHSQKYAEALNDFSEAIKLDQENALYRIRRAETFYFLERYSEASIDLEQALSIDPKSGAALGIRGRVRLQLKGLCRRVARFGRSDKTFVTAVCSTLRPWRSLSIYKTL